MRNVLLATDSDEIHTEIDAALGSSDTTVHRVRTGREVRPAVIELDPDLVILDLQIGSMGGIATCLDLRLEEGVDRLELQNVVLLLDREADVFMARRSGADGWLIKPLDPRRIAAASSKVISGEEYTEGPELVET